MSPSPETLKQAKRPVVFLAGGIGDFVLAVPSLRALSNVFGKRLIVILRDYPARNFLFRELGRKNRITLEFTGRYWRQFDVDLAVRKVRWCDLFLSLVGWKSRSLATFVRRLCPSISVGCSDEFDINVGYDYSQHAADCTFEVVRLLLADRKLENFAGPLQFSAQDHNAAKEIIRCFPAETGILAVHNETARKKKWPTERLTRTLNRFLQAHEDFVVLLIGGFPASLGNIRHRDRVFSCHGLSLGTSCCLVSHADVFLGIDSCMLHVADFSRVPSVGIFGATKAANWGLRLGPGVELQGKNATSDISVEKVVAALHLQVLQSRTKYRIQPNVDVVQQAIRA